MLVPPTWRVSGALVGTAGRLVAAAGEGGLVCREGEHLGIVEGVREAAKRRC